MPRKSPRNGFPAVYNSSPVTYADGDGVALQTDENGNLLVKPLTAVTPTNTSIADGKKTVTTAGARVALVASATPCKEVCIQANSANTGAIAVGGSTVVAAAGATRSGVILNANDSVTISISDLANVFIDSTVSGEGVYFTYSA